MSDENEKLHTVTIRIPFHNPSHALIALRGLQVDKEQNSIFVQRQLVTEGNDLVVTYSATTVRLLRLATNTFLSSCDLVIRTMEEFAPDPEDERVSDEQLEQRRNLGGGDGDGKGIELKGNGVGAGSGQEVA